MAEEQKLPILYVIPSGPPEFRRFAIADEQNRFWDGQQFSKTGQLYARHHEAALQLQAILKSHFAGVEPVRLVAPVVVDVFSRTPTDHLAVANYLSQAARLWINTNDFGYGPNGSLVSTQIPWGRLRQAKTG